MKKILVANRGEIALRVMQSIKEMGIQTVAIYSEADRQSLHTQFADEAVCIGPPPSKDSYLLGDKIIEVAKSLDVDGIHPGYGFLSENAEFAKKVTDAGLNFIGPSPEAIEVMGDKLAAKQAVKEYEIPMVPGVDEAITDVKKAKEIASEIGYPILIKAAAGGGGKGMRIVEAAKDFEEQMERAVSEAISAFGNGAVFIEKFVSCPRHIEIQVLADKHGNIVYLNERECSIQRRHQKVIEEAPSAVLTEELRSAMGQSAIDVAKACDYIGAGTVEFLIDDQHNYYFLEMNTRLQVEHPVTELITGLDLVKEQVKVAMGERLSFTQSDVGIYGHALQLRVYAEDPENNFLPDIGKLEKYELPVGPGVRVDTAFKEGMTIPVYYDPMIAKLIVHAGSREEAIAKMKSAIEDYQVVGVKTTLGFGDYVMSHTAFISGNFDTNFIKEHYSGKLDNQLTVSDEAYIASVFLAQYLGSRRVDREKVENADTISSWKLKRKKYLKN